MKTQGRDSWMSWRSSGLSEEGGAARRWSPADRAPQPCGVNQHLRLESAFISIAPPLSGLQACFPAPPLFSRSRTPMSSSPYPLLLGDVGGTNARFAWAAAPDAALSDIAQYPCAEHPSLHAAIGHYLQQHQRPAPRACAIGIANPITGDRVQMTNHHWSFSISELRRELAVARLAVVNDFTALALSLPALDRADLHA